MNAEAKEADDEITGLLESLAIKDAVASETSKQQEGAADEDITGLLGSLTLNEDSVTETTSKQQEEGAKPDANSVALQVEIDRAGFRIFKCIADKGYLSWKPPPSDEPLYKNLSSITTSEEITQYIDRNGKPDKLIQPLSNIRVPVAFRNDLPPQEYANKFPYGQHEIASLHVAVKDRNVDLNHDIDFVFGGSTLEMLANCDNENPYMLTRISGTHAIIITKQKQYVADFSTFGFQFERLVTGKRLDDQSNVVESVEHLQVMKIGKYRVLFLAETDALLEDDGPPVEVKASSPFHWGTKVLFQMISSGSTKLCHGVKGRGKNLTRVYLKSLSSVAKNALEKSPSSTKQLEENILQGMDSIMTKMKDESVASEENNGSCQVFKIHFKGKSLQLLPVRGPKSIMLPPAEIVRELVA